MSEITGDTSFFLTYGCKLMKLPDVSLLPLSCPTRPVDQHRERMINLIRMARSHVAGHTYTAQQKMKEYHDQQGKNHSLGAGHGVWIYKPAIKAGLSKNFVLYGMVFSIKKVTPVSFRVTDEKRNELKETVPVNSMKQYYSPLNKPYNDTSPTVIEQDVEDLIVESELSSDEADEMEEIESDTDTNNMAQNENATQEISCQHAKITGNIKLSTIEGEHHNQVLETPKNLHIYYVEKIK